MSQQISRRNIAKGAAWATPAVLATSAIPAYAASTDRSANAPYGSICSLFFGSGTVSWQRTTVSLQANSLDGMLYAGQTISWVFNMSSGTVPGLDYPKDGSSTLTTSPPTGTRATQFTVTLTVKRDIPVSAINCQARLLWDSSGSTGSSSITPKSTLSVSSSGKSGSYSSTITIPKRYGTSYNDSSRTPLRIDGKCYPTIQWSDLGNSTRDDKDTILYFNGSGPILPDSNAGNTQKITTGTCQ